MVKVSPLIGAETKAIAPDRNPHTKAGLHADRASINIEQLDLFAS